MPCAGQGTFRARSIPSSRILWQRFSWNVLTTQRHFCNRDVWETVARQRHCIHNWEADMVYPLIQFRLISYPLPLFCDLFFFSSQLPRPLAVWTTWGAIYGALAGRAIQGWKGIPLLLGCGRGWEAPQWDPSIAGLFLERLSMLCGYTFESFKHNLQLVLFFGEQVCYVCPRSMRSCQLRSLVYSEETMMLASLLKHEHSWHGNLMKFASTNAPSFRHIFAGRC